MQPNPRFPGQIWDNKHDPVPFRNLSWLRPGQGWRLRPPSGRMHMLLWGWLLLQGWWCPSAFWVVSASSPGLPRTIHHSPQQWMSFRVAARCKEGRWRSSASWCQVKKGRIWAGPQVTMPHAASGESSQPISWYLGLVQSASWSLLWPCLGWLQVPRRAPALKRLAAHWAERCGGAQNGGGVGGRQTPPLPAAWETVS